MPAQFKTTIMVDDFFNDPQRTIARVMKGAMRTAGEYWHKTYLPLHFQMTAYHRYPTVYKRRKAVRWRDPKTGQWLEMDPAPLKETGRTRAMAMTSLGPEAGKWEGISGTSLRVRIKFVVPGYLMWIRQHGYKPLEELTATNAQERRVLARIVDDELEKELNRPIGYLSPLKGAGVLGAGYAGGPGRLTSVGRART